MSPDWAALVRSAQPSIVLPAGSRRAQHEVPGPLELVEALDLGPGRAVAVVRAADGSRWCVPVVADGANLRRGEPGDGTAQALARLLADAEGTGHRGGFTWRGFGRARHGHGPQGASAHGIDGTHGERGVEVDQTNVSVIVDEAIVVKWMTRLAAEGEPGSPAAARIAALAAAGFVDMPAPGGVLVHGAQVDTGQVLATTVAYLPGAEDGWDWATADLRAYLRGELTLDRAVEPARQIGAITAAMHAGLARLGVHSATADRAGGWARNASEDLTWAQAATSGAFADRLRHWHARISPELKRLAAATGTPTIAIHGDLHVGQVLRTIEPGGADRYWITDFDGNPTMPMAQRWEPQPAAVDVVGMLASLDHVGRVVQYRDAGSDLHAIRTWISATQQEFLACYRDRAEALGVGDLLDERLIEPWRLWQEVREIRYAIEHLPHWVYVPELALADLLSQDQAPEIT